VKTTNEQLFDRYVQRQIHLKQYADGLSDEAGKLLKGTEDDVTKALLFYGSKLEGEPLSSTKARELRKAMKGEISESRAGAWAAIGALMAADLKTLAVDEAAFAMKALDDSLPMDIAMAVPKKSELNTLTTQTPFQGKTISEHVSHMQAQDANVIADRTTLALEQDNTPTALVLSVMGTVALLRRDGVVRRARNWADAVIGTGVTSTAYQARSAFAAENALYIKQEYFRATLDAVTTPKCQATDGKIFDIGKGLHPPLHYDCVTGDTLVSAGTKITGVSKRWHDGEVVVITTALGNRLTCTPNHPVLTSRGFIEAGLLDVGGNVISRVSSKGVLGGDVNHKHVPALAEEIASSFFRSGKMRTSEVPMTAHDFHGDGKGSKVAIVSSDRFLHNAIYAALLKGLSQANLIVRYHVRRICCAILACCGYFFSLLLRLYRSTAGIVSSFGLMKALGFRHLRPLERFRFGLSSPLYSSAVDYVDNDGPSSRVSLFKRLDAFTRHVASNNFTFGDIGSGLRASNNADAVSLHKISNDFWGDAKLSGKLAQGCFATAVLIKNSVLLVRRKVCSNMFNASLLDNSSNLIGADRKLASNILAGGSGLVQSDDVVAISRENFSGHVYNFETIEGCYDADGIVTHNCRSVRAPFIDPNISERGFDPSTEKTLVKEYSNGVITSRDSLPYGQKGDYDAWARKRRREMIGTVPSEVTYGEWLLNQSKDFQDEVLGIERAKLFRRGKIPLSKFVNRQGRYLTLDQLRAKGYDVAN